MPCTRERETRGRLKHHATRVRAAMSAAAARAATATAAARTGGGADEKEVEAAVQAAVRAIGEYAAPAYPGRESKWKRAVEAMGKVEGLGDEAVDTMLGAVIDAIPDLFDKLLEMDGTRDWNTACLLLAVYADCGAHAASMFSNGALMQALATSSSFYYHNTSAFNVLAKLSTYSPRARGGLVGHAEANVRHRCCKRSRK